MPRYHNIKDPQDAFDLPIAATGFVQSLDGEHHFLVTSGDFVYDTLNRKVYRGAGGAPPAVPWTPADITTIAWYDADDASTITESGGAVSQWDDKSGNGYHQTQPTGANQPTTGVRTQNSLNVLDLDGNDRMFALNVPTDSNVAMFLVSEVDSVAATSDSMFTLQGGKVSEFSSTTIPQFTGRVEGATFTGGPFTGCRIFNVNYDWSGASVVNGYLDGTKVRADTAYVGGFNATAAIKLFSRGGNTGNPNGAIGEVILVNDFTQSTREKIEGYLAWKWGLVANLPGGHPYKSEAPTV